MFDITHVLKRDLARAGLIAAAMFALAFILIVTLNIGLTAAGVGAVAMLGQVAAAAPVQQSAAMAALPFTASAHEHTEPAFTLTVTPGGAVQQQNPVDIPASGYLRSILLEITATGGAGGTIGADFPWNLIQSLTLQDVNGANIVGPIDGYALMLANLFGGYRKGGTHIASTSGAVFTGPNPSFFLRVPVEISERDALGALANQNAAANYKLAIAINSRAAVMSVDWTTAPTLTIKGWLEAWTLPADRDNRGRPQAQVPPLLGTGQYLSATTRTVLVGSNTLGLTRVGNYLRNLILVARTAAGARDNTVFPDPFRFNWDGNQILNQSFASLRYQNWERTSGLNAVPAGVLVIPFSHGGMAGGTLGNESPDLWLPTTQSSRIEVDGNSATAGSLQMVVNEVAPVEVNQAERFQVPSDTGAVAA